jgi:CNT family concentrative nucleoside transporter
MIQATLLIALMVGIAGDAESAVPDPLAQPSAGSSSLPGTRIPVETAPDRPRSSETPVTPVLQGPIAIRKIWEISIGPWKWQVSLPDSVDPYDLADRLRGFVGMFAIIGVGIFLSTDRSAISGRILFWGIVLQWLFAFLVLRVSIGVELLKAAGDAVKSVLDCALAGADFVFGATLVDPNGPAKFVFAFRVLPTVIFVAALFAVLYHVGIMQWIVRVFAWVMSRLMRTSGAETLDVAASLFLGQTEAPLTIRPYLPKMTNSELMTVMTAGMAHVSGGVMAAYFAFGVEPRHVLTAVIMTAPGAIMMSKLLVPETGTPETLGTLRTDSAREDANILDAASRGTREGLALALNIAAMLIAFLGLIALVNLGLGRFGTSLQAIFGWALAPVAYFLGVPWEDCRAVGGLLGTRTVLNELIAFGELSQLREDMLARSSVIASFALCGFANIGSIGVQIGGIGSLAPDRRHDLARLGVRALLAGTLANYLSACIAGVLL